MRHMKDNHMDQCDMYSRCENHDNCVLCNDYRLLKTPGDKFKRADQAKYNKQAAKTDTRADSNDSWNDLEATVAAALNTTPTHKQYQERRLARRQARSGGIWFMPGDVTDQVMLMECKERSTLDSHGKNQITIKKEWLDKIISEADGNQYPALAFRYKGAENVYFVQRLDVLIEMVGEIKYLREENARLTEISGKHYNGAPYVP